MNAIELKNVCLKQGSFTMKNVSFALESGYVLGLIGPNGAGKSTSLRMLLGLCLPDSGGGPALGPALQPGPEPGPGGRCVR